VAVALGDGAARAPVGVDEALVDVGVVGAQPRQERGPDVEGHVLEHVDAPALHFDLGDRAVALVGDALVPVVERRGRGLLGHLARPGVLPGRLVEVPVDDERDRIAHQEGTR
jgi:hypothetical protein